MVAVEERVSFESTRGRGVRPGPTGRTGFHTAIHTAVVTLVDTDVVYSSRWNEALDTVAASTLVRFHRELAEEVLAGFSWAWIVDRPEDKGRNGLLIAFMRPSDAVRFALQLQARFRSVGTGVSAPLHARVGIHMGEVRIGRQNGSKRVTHVEGSPVGTAAQVMAVAHGGQILMTGGVFRNALSVLNKANLPGLGPIAWANHGPYRLGGTGEVVDLCEVGEHGPVPFTPPPKTAAVHKMERGRLKVAWNPLD